MESVDETKGGVYDYYEKPVWLGEPGEQQPMIHMDFQVSDMQEAKDYALSLGATEPDEQFCQPDWEPQWIMLFDPAGHPFCIFE